jgi:hypothetical protein
VAIASIAGDLSSQLVVQQARRAAEQAETSARALRAQASTASRAADQAQERARQLQVRSDQADGDLGSARRNVAALEANGQLQTGYQSIRDSIAETIATLDIPEPAPVPVANAEGQLTGTLVNVTA